MKKSLYLPIMACAMGTFVACNSQKQQAEAPTAGIDLANMDTTANRGADFYQYACGGWMANHPLTGEYSRFGSFDMLAENNRKQLRELIEEIAKKKNEKGTVAQKIGDLYNMAMDSVKRNADGMAPIKEYYTKLGAANKAEYAQTLATMRRDGMSPFFGFYVGADAKNSSQNLLEIYQSGITLGEKEYYIDQDENTKNIMDNYKKFIVKMFQLAGEDEATANKKMQNVMTVETALAKASKSNLELRDPQANYNKMSYEQLKKDFPGFDWDAYFGVFGIKDLKEVGVGQVEFVKSAIKYLNSTDAKVIADYLQWNLLTSSASYLSDDFYNASFDFYGRVLSGKEEQSPRWKRSVSVVDGTLGEAVGQLYVEKYFPAEAKERMVKLVKNLQVALGERIDMQEWMSDETKQKAHEKLNTFYVKVGYPDKWRDYSALEINDDSFWENIRRATNFEYDYNISKLGKPVDKTEWGMTPQTVNAYYNPTTNEICFPAGILQYPFFDMNADDAFNYGAIGVVIGHEMTHGFDDQGRNYDKDGNLSDWWTEEDAKLFVERAEVLVKQYDDIIVVDTVHANGRFTLGENIADQGGLLIAHQAYMNSLKGKETPAPIEGFTHEQRFYLGYATLWGMNIRPEEIVRMTKIDPHSLGKWRVNAALKNIDSFYEAFNIKEGDPMYLAPEKRVNIW